MMRPGHAISWRGAALLALPVAFLLVANRSYDVRHASHLCLLLALTPAHPHLLGPVNLQVVGGGVPLPLLSPHAPGEAVACIRLVVMSVRQALQRDFAPETLHAVAYRA